MDVPSPVAGASLDAGQEGSRSRRDVIATVRVASAARRRPVRAASAASAPRRSAAPRRRPAQPRRCRRPAPAPPRGARSGRARRGPGRLHGGFPRRGPRAEGDAGRALADARRRLPERRLHSLQGAAARREGHRGGRATMAACGIVFGRRGSTWIGCAPGRASVVGKLTSGLAALAKQRKVDGRCAASAKFVGPHALEPSSAEGAQRVSTSSNASSRRDPNRCDCPACRTIRASSIRPARSSCRGRQAPAGHRRRHHRSRDGLRVRCAGRARERGRADRAA